MIGWQHRHDARGRARPDERGSEGDGSAGVPANGLGHDIVLRQFGQLLAHRRRLGLVGDDENVFERHQRQHAVHRLLQERAFAQQGEQLLGRFLAAQRPEPLAASARHDNDKVILILGARFHKIYHAQTSTPRARGESLKSKVQGPKSGDQEGDKA